MAGIAFVGTGWVADFYKKTLANHPSLLLTGAWDRDPAALQRFSQFYNVPAYANLDEVLADPEVQIVVNLTTPESHFEICERALLAGKHVYCEKPLAMRFEDAQKLMQLAEERGLTLTAAPANALSPAAYATKAAIERGDIGLARLVYAEMEDAAAFRENWRNWRSISGAPWPGEHEFEVGCTLEHAGYALSWMLMLFGPARSVTAFSALTFPDKGSSHPLGPDFSVGAIKFESGVVARLTSGLAKPKDRSMTILGDKGTLFIDDLWDHTARIRLHRASDKRRLLEKITTRLEAKLGRQLPYRPLPGKAVRYSHPSGVSLPNFPSRIDFCAGIAAQADAVANGRTPYFSGHFALHLVELALALSDAGNEGGLYRMRSTFSLPPAG